jgi:hypothetical protein
MGGSLYSLRAVSGADDSRAFSAGLASTKLAPEGARLTTCPGRGEEAGKMARVLKDCDCGCGTQVWTQERKPTRLQNALTRAAEAAAKDNKPRWVRTVNSTNRPHYQVCGHRPDLPAQSRRRVYRVNPDGSSSLDRA